MSYLCDLPFIFSLIFVVINHITSLKQTHLFFLYFFVIFILFLDGNVDEWVNLNSKSSVSGCCLGLLYWNICHPFSDLYWPFDPDWSFVSFWNIKSHYFTYSHLLSFVLLLTFTVAHCFFLLLVVIPCHSLSLVVTCCHSLPLVVTCCTSRLSFYKRSLQSLIFHLSENGYIAKLK